MRRWRDEKGYTQADLAEILELKYYSFVSQVENGIGRIPQSLYGPWADALGVDREEFCWTVLAAIEPRLYDGLAHHDQNEASRPRLLQDDEALAAET
ncbi:MAG: helix-turn-helix transcriptional regulator [Pseudomonadota bacterium]